MEEFKIGFRKQDGTARLVPFSEPHHEAILARLASLVPSPMIIGDNTEIWRSWKIDGRYPNGSGYIWPGEYDEGLVRLAERGARDMKKTLAHLRSYPIDWVVDEILERCGLQALSLIDAESFRVQALTVAQCHGDKPLEAYCTIQTLVNTEDETTGYRIKIPGLCETWPLRDWGHRLITERVISGLATRLTKVLYGDNEATA